ncbi:MAG: FHA domain-containing protein [Victivallaceae bacterium]|nr:FHA domain-containing protein [Victivallaceae bacterium]
MKIFFVNGIRAGEEIELAVPEITIGREEDNLLRIPVAGVSRYHAKLKRGDDGVWSVVDLGSTNGVKINSRRIKADQALTEGDLVEIGDQMIRFTGLDDAPPQVIFATVGSGESEPPTTAKVVKAPDAPPVSGSEVIAKLRSGAELFSLHTSAAAEKIAQKVTPSKKSVDNRLRRNLVFGAILFFGVVAIVIFFLRVLPLFQQKPQAVKREIPFALFYEKENVRPDNVFRFSVRVENGEAEFTIDDISSQRHYVKKVKADATSLAILRSRIEDSGAWKLGNSGTARTGVAITRRFMAAEPERAFDFVKSGDMLPEELKTVELAIDSFTENFGLQTISLTPEELLTMAANHYEKAAELFANSGVANDNLRNAIKGAELARNALEQFSPPPPLFRRADELYKEAVEQRERKLAELALDWSSCSSKRDYQGLRQVLLRQMDLFDLDSKEYDFTRQKLFKLDQYLRRNSK